MMNLIQFFSPCRKRINPPINIPEPIVWQGLALRHYTSSGIQSALYLAHSDSQLVTSSNSLSILWITIKKMMNCYGRTEQEKHREAVLYAARLFRHLPPWLYTTYFGSLKRLNLAPWNDPTFKQIPDVFAKAREILLSKDSGNKNYRIITPDGAVLDAIVFPGASKKVILFVPGLTESYESCSVDGVCGRMVKFFKEQYKEINVMIVNPRGVGRSTGVTVPSTLRVDLFTAYQFLINSLQFDPAYILVWGHSLGGCYAVQGGALVQEQYPQKKISVVIDRSFLDITDVVKSWKGPMASSKIVSLAERYFHSEHLRLSSREAVVAIKGKVVVIFSEADRTVVHDVAFITKAIAEKLHIQDLCSIKISNQEVSSEFLAQHHQRRFFKEEAEQISAVMHEIFDGKIPVSEQKSSC